MTEEILKNKAALEGIEEKLKAIQQTIKPIQSCVSSNCESRFSILLLSICCNYITELRMGLHNTYSLIRCLESIYRFPDILNYFSLCRDFFERLELMTLIKSLNPQILMEALDIWIVYWRKYEKGRAGEKNGNKIEKKIRDFRNELEKSIRTGTLRPETEEEKILTPQKIKEYADKYVVGQETAKKMLATIIYEYKKGIKNSGNRGNIAALLAGPTGCGKNYLLETMAACPGVNLPVFFYDLSSITPAGYDGESKNQIFKGFVSHCKAAGVPTTRGIIVLDEADKKMRPSISRDGSDFNAEAMSQLLTVLTGDGVIEGVKCSDILFLLSGAFMNILEKKEERKMHIGFGHGKAEVPENVHRLTREDMIRGGMMREVAGRISVIIPVDRLTRNQMREILIGTEHGLLREYTEGFARYGTELIIREEAIEALVDKAFEENLGARALKNVLSEILFPIKYDAGERKADKCIIQKETILQGEPPCWEVDQSQECLKKQVHSKRKGKGEVSNEKCFCV